MELREYGRAMVRRWRWLLVPLLLAVGIAVALTVTTAPPYRSVTVLFVAGADANGTDQQSSRLNSYVTLLTGPRVADTVRTQLRLPLSRQSVQDRISAEVQPGTNLLVVAATDASAERSRTIVTSATTSFIALARKLDAPRNGTSRASAVRISVVQDAVTARLPSPLPRNLGFAVIMGLLVGAAAVAVREALRKSIVDDRDLAQLGVETIGVVSLGERSGRRGRPNRAGRHPDDPLTEEFRRLRAMLPGYARAQGGRGQSLLVTSAVPREGTTTIACGLAIALAEAGVRVALVDANLRAPELGAYLRLDTTRGLTEVLAGTASLPAVLQDSADGRLAVLTAGTPTGDPGELLATPGLGPIIDSLTSRYDVVLIDAPPLRPVADGAVLSKLTDGVLLVVRVGRTGATDVERSVDILRRVGARLVGAVLNALPKKPVAAGLWQRLEPASPARERAATATARPPQPRTQPRTQPPQPRPSSPGLPTRVGAESELADTRGHAPVASGNHAGRMPAGDTTLPAQRDPDRGAASR